MSYEESLKSISLVADASIGIYTGVPGLPGSPQPHGGKQYCFLEVTGVGTAGLCTAAARSVGVLQNKPQEVGHAATVGISGVTRIITGGVVTAGDEIEVDASGRGVTKSAGVTVAIALDTSTGADQLIPALLV